MKLCVLGGVNWDVVSLVEQMPRPGETVTACGILEGAGGKALNQAVAAARFGATVGLLGGIGDDDPGRKLRTFLDENRVDHRYLRSYRAAPTGKAHINLAADGENMIVVHAGANALYDGSDIPYREIAECRVFLTQFEATLPAIEALFSSPPARDGIRILNAAPALSPGRPLFELPDILIVNETELGQFAVTMGDPTGTDAVATAARTLIRRPDQNVVVTLGARGSALITLDTFEMIPAAKVPVVDTIGAGDCFCGVLAAALAEGQPLNLALHQANVAAALSVGSRGAATSAPSREAIIAFERTA